MPFSFTLVQLETFVWLAELKSFSKTASFLNTTQPGVTSRIHALEQALGTKLFDRTTGSVHLTPEGNQLLKYAHTVQNAAKDLESRSNNSATFKGVLRLGVSETIVHTMLPKFMSEIRSRYPLLDVEITVEATVELRNELIARSIDLAFLMGPISEYRMQNVELFSVPLVWVAAKGLFEKGRTLETTELPILTYGRNTRPFVEISQYFAQQGTPRRVFPSNSLAACIQMARDGLGVATLPKQVVQTELDLGQLEEISQSWHPSALQFTATYSSIPPNPLATEVSKIARTIAQSYKLNL